MATDLKTHTLEVPGAVLAYDVREPAAGASAEIPLLMISSPMGAAGFGTLAKYFDDRVVVMCDPRGSERSVRTDRTDLVTPGAHADDLHRLVAALDVGKVDVFASSGGAVNALAWVARHPEQVRTLVAHEPPLASVLPDRDVLYAATADVYETYQRRGWGPAMAKFLALLDIRGPVPADYLGRSAPEPSAFGLPSDDDGSRDDPMFAHSMLGGSRFRLDVEALRSASTRIVIAAGVASEGEMMHRAADAVAELLGTTTVLFPSGHDGFLGGEYGQTGEPEAFAARLREVLAQSTASAPSAPSAPSSVAGPS